ncbi:hypothetical protein [Halorubrum distributum]|uniref:hypothetical protein n=1 Tax=Halorubrum distributum TaxID=29283 RepID=UPI0006778B48|nr:hypothetical protein [Halorubrum terrestre]
MSTPVYGPGADDPDSGDGGSDLPETLQRFASSPTGFILGAILSPLLRGLNNIVVTFLDLITFVFQGSSPGLVGTLGLVDIPLFIGTELIEIGATIGGSSVEGTGLLGIVSTVIDAGTAFASIGGPLAPIILAGEVVVVVYVFAFVTERIVLVIADAVPGLAGILGT